MWDSQKSQLHNKLILNDEFNSLIKDSIKYMRAEEILYTVNSYVDMICLKLIRDNNRKTQEL